MRTAIIVFLTGCILSAAGQDIRAFQLYDSKGKTTDFNRLVTEAAKADVVFFGEQHNDPVVHWLQYELLVVLNRKLDGNVILGMEMLEADVQLILDEYLAGRHTEKTFMNEARVWTNHATDYQPMIRFATEQHIPVIATNVPRRYASLVYRQGPLILDSLDADSKRWLPELPLRYDTSQTSYRELSSMSGHGAAGLTDAQALKDLAMAMNIDKHFLNGKVFLHLNGTFHTDRHQGIVTALNARRPGLKILTISSVGSEDPHNFDDDWNGLADFILVTDSNVTRSH